MSFIKTDFTKLSRDNRLKKVLYGIKEFLNNSKELSYAIDLLNWINEYEKTNLLIPENNENWKNLYITLFNILKNENPFIEDEPFDKTDKAKTVNNIKVLLDDIRSPHNVGSIIRTCECFGVEEIILTGITPSPDNNPKIKKTAMGSKLKHSSFNNAIEIIHRHKEQGYKIYSIDKTKNSKNIRRIIIETPALIVLGNEEFGINKNLLEVSDLIFHIDMLGLKNSLNVSIACGIALFEITNNL